MINNRGIGFEKIRKATSFKEEAQGRTCATSFKEEAFGEFRYHSTTESDTPE